MTLTTEKLRALLASMTPDGPFIVDRNVWFDEHGARHGETPNIVVPIVDLLAEVIALREQKAALVEALREIAEIKERKKSCYPEDWREQIAACPECQQYKDHPIQRGICDLHRKPIYAQEDHDRHETTILGYRAMEIARAALSKEGA